MRSMKTSWLAAGAIIIVLILWMASGMLRSEDRDKAASITTGEDVMRVEVLEIELNKMSREVILQGQLEPIQHLHIRAETSGTVQSLPMLKGSRITTGDLLLTLDPGGRENSLREAQATVKSAESAQLAAASLKKQGLQSKLQLEQSEAQLEAARAVLASIELDIANTQIRAPFSGILNDLPLSKGALADHGDVLAELVDDSAFEVSAQAAQQTVESLEVGQEVTVNLITGTSLPGKLTYISSVADSQSRSFKVEAKVENPGGSIAAGVSASVIIPVANIEAAFLTPSALVLNDDGALGVKIVSDDNTVEFVPVVLESTTLDGAWVTGIAAGTRVITLGQGFVTTGEVVEAQLSVDQGS